MGEDDARLRAVVSLAQTMAAAYTPRDSWRAAALGACEALGGSFAALSVWERDRGRLRVLVNAGQRAEGEEEFPEEEAYPVHEFPEITEFLHERWAGGGEPDAWVETADGLPGAGGPARGARPYCHQRVFKGRDHEVGYMYDVRDASGQPFGSFHEDAGA
ncbi:diguanylate cyclase, partial [Streptomyces cyaneofuscatus]